MADYSRDYLKIKDLAVNEKRFRAIDKWQEEKIMITLSDLTELLGWASVINIAYLLLATLILMFMRGTISSIHNKMFDIDEKVYKYFDECDEVWHAGDIGSIELADKMEAFKPFRAVYGNIDNADLRRRYPLDLRFECDGLDVWMTHIGGYPYRYNPRVREALNLHPPKLFISGHSHILKVQFDKKLQLFISSI